MHVHICLQFLSSGSNYLNEKPKKETNERRLTIWDSEL